LIAFLLYVASSHQNNQCIRKKHRFWDLRSITVIESLIFHSVDQLPWFFTYQIQTGA
jgi:hypothetical protein